jgi:hypothetical protein
MKDVNFMMILMFKKDEYGMMISISEQGRQQLRL